MATGKVPLEKMTIRHQRVEAKAAEQKPTEGMVETVFPTNLEHDKECKKGKTEWLYEIDEKTGAVTLSCDKCKATYTFEIGAEEE